MEKSDYKIIYSFEDGKKLVEMNDGSGYTVVYENGRISSARFEKITEFDMYGFAMVYRKGDEKPSLMIDRGGDIYQITKVLDKLSTTEIAMEREINARKAESDVNDEVRKKGKIRIF